MKVKMLVSFYSSTFAVLKLGNLFTCEQTFEKGQLRHVKKLTFTLIWSKVLENIGHFLNVWNKTDKFVEMKLKSY